MNGQQDRIGLHPQTHYGLYGGMDRGSEPHLLKPEQWRTLFNVRSTAPLSQVPCVKYLYGYGLGSTDAIVNFPTGRLDFGLWYALSRQRLYTFTPTSATLVASYNDCADRFSTHMYNGRLFYTNHANRVRYLDGNGVHEVFEGRWCWAKSAGDLEFPETQGPFQLETLWDGTTPVGYLGSVFTWTTGTKYRVFVEKPKRFVTGATVSISWIDSTTQTKYALAGMVLYVEEDTIVVKATTTVASVPNTSPTPVYEVRVTDMAVPLGRYVTTFFDHLVIGAPKYAGSTQSNRCIWSHLYDFALWEPGTDNEADGYTFTEYQRSDDIVAGVTGMAHFGEQLLIFTPSCVYSMTYTGLPRVVRVAPLLKDFGNGLPYAVAELNNAVVWCDVHHQTFFAFRGGGPEDIGAPIADYFFGDLYNDSAWMAKTFAYVDRSKNEVVWVYRAVGEMAGQFNRAVAYDYVRNAWSARSVNNVTCFGYLNRRAKAVNELVGNIAAQSATCDALEETSDRLYAVYGGNACVLRDEQTTDASVETQEQPYLETGDLIYGSTFTMKEVSQMIIHATASTTLSIAVYVSVRNYLDEAVSWTLVGTWTTSLANKVLTFTPKAGRILRYKFVPASGVRGLVFRGYEDNVLSAGAYR